MRQSGVLVALAISILAACNGESASKFTLKAIEVASPAEPPMPKPFDGLKSMPGRLAKITLTAGANLRRAAESRDLHVAVDAWFCSNTKRVLSHVTFVFDANGVIDENDTAAASIGNEVWVYLDESSEGRATPELDKTVPRYDLRESTEDVCLQIRARNMAFMGFASKIIRIPAKQLNEALK